MKEPLPDLLDFSGKPVWDTRANHSVAHLTEQIDWECYCRLEVSEGDFTELVAMIRDITSSVLHRFMPTASTGGSSP